MYVPRSVSGAESDIRTQLSIRESRAALSFPFSPRELSHKSVEYRENRDAIIPGRDIHSKTDDVARSVECVHARTGLFYLDAFPQLARSISHTQITHFPSLPSVLVIYVLVPGCHRSRFAAIVVARVRSTVFFDQQIARDQTTSITPTVERSLIYVW